MKKLVLIYANQRWLKDDVVTTWTLDPRTIATLAAMVRDIVDVEIIDAQINHLSQEAFAQAIAKAKPDYIGISQLTTEYAAILDTAADICKAAAPKAIVIAGGVHVTLHPKETMQNGNIDYCCHGEGEYLLREIILYHEGKGEFPKKGLVYREDGAVCVQDKAVIEDLTKLPWPAYDLLDFPAYCNSIPREGANRYPEMPGMSMIVSRGCPYFCSFCQVATIAGRKARMRDPKDVVEEIKFAKRTYGIRSITFFDDNFFLPKTEMKEFLRLLIQEKVDIKWQSAGAAIWVLDEEFMQLMKDSGCVGITVAIESGNERVLHDIINKPIKDLAAIPQKIAKIKEYGVWVAANFVIGSPGETWEEIRETVTFAENCNADYVKFYVAVPLYGTRMYDEAKAQNLLLGDNDGPRVDWRYSVISSPEWTPKDVSVLRVYEWDRINFAPERIEKICEIWGTSSERLGEIRKRTRDSLAF
jgi:anaerobic magnesium-protoporphyrin IX monomethyl ester cyclase